MGKPRMIILIRHAQSEGNLNRDVHQIIPDHRIKLTPEGWTQAEEAGVRLRNMLRPTDTIRIFTSPYRRTRETTEGILHSLTSPDKTNTPSPFSRDTIKVYEEPRLREQDFGNFQPCSAEMERMWQERSDYGHFFYRIRNGESAADVYDRISSFDESLWRNFADEDFPSVCVLVTHGLMTRVFLMRWFRWSVEYFEDLRNVNHCQFVIMKLDDTTGKYLLENNLKTWSELKRKAAVKQKTQNVVPQISSPVLTKQWGGCVDGCNHSSSSYATRQIQNYSSPGLGVPSNHSSGLAPLQLPPAQLNPSSTTNDDEKIDDEENDTTPPPEIESQIDYFHEQGRENTNGIAGQPPPDDERYNNLPIRQVLPCSNKIENNNKIGDERDIISKRRSSVKSAKRQTTQQDVETWKSESGMGRGTRADALGDSENGDGVSDDDEVDHKTRDEKVDDGDKTPVEKVEDDERKDKSLRSSVY